MGARSNDVVVSVLPTSNGLVGAKGTPRDKSPRRWLILPLVAIAVSALAWQPTARANPDDIQLIMSGSFSGYATGSPTSRTYSTSIIPQQVNAGTLTNGAVVMTVAIHDKRWSVAGSGVVWGATTVGTSAVKARACLSCSDPDAPATEIWGAVVGSTGPNGYISVTLSTSNGSLADPEITIGYYVFSNVLQTGTWVGPDGGFEGNPGNRWTRITASASDLRSAGISVFAADSSTTTARLTTSLDGESLYHPTLELPKVNGTIGNLLAFGSYMPVNDVYGTVASDFYLSAFTRWAGGIVSILPFGPTAVRVNSFTAASTGSGTRLRWRTGAEVANLGFNVYREENGVSTPVNTTLIAGSAFFVGATVNLRQGKGYEWIDPRPADSSVRYWLEAIDVNGTKETLGPVFAERSKVALTQEGEFAPAVPLHALGQGAEPEAGQPGISASDWAKGASGEAGTPIEVAGTEGAWDGSRTFKQQGLAAGDAAKIGVTQEGWYSVSRAALLAAGFDSGSDGRRLQLFADGVEVPIIVRTSGNSANAQISSVEFYGTPIDTPYSGKHVYWLVRGNSWGLRVDSAGQNRASTSVPPSFPFTVERKDRTIYFTALTNNGDTSNFFGKIVNSTQADLAIALNHVDKTAAGTWPLQVVLQGATYPQPHVVDVLVNGSKVGTAAFKDQQRPTTTFQVPASSLLEGTNTVSLIARGGATDVSVVDTIRLTYPHQYVADTGALKLTAAGGSGIVISGFPDSSARILDVTDPFSVTELGVTSTGSAGSFTASAVVPSGGTRTLLAFASSRVLAPATIVANKASSLNSDSGRADLAIITNGSLNAAASTLKSLRESQGLSTKVVDVEDIYDEFNFGHKSPYAIRAYLLLRRNFGTKYVVLVGDSTLDPRDYLGLGDFDLLPTKLVPTTYLKTASDDWFVDFDGNGLPELAVGRLSARSAAEANTVVGKLKAYELGLSTSPAWRKAVIQIADQDDPPSESLFSFEKQVATLGLAVPNQYSVNNILVGQLGVQAAHDAIVTQVNGGAMLVTYVGHATEETWGKSSVFGETDAAALANGTKLPVFLTMDCLNGFFIDVYADSLAESLQKQPNGGAAAVWASSTLTNPKPQADMVNALYKAVFGASGVRLGDAIKTAKAATNDSDVRKSWILFGDPTMKLR